jgi:DNA-binding protein
MIADILHKIASMEQKEETRYYPRPSLAGPERCIRQLVYWGLRVPREPLPGRTLHVFDDGVIHEKLVANWIRKSAYQLFPEHIQMKVDCGQKGNIHLIGHIDGLLTDISGKNILWENKSINHFTCQRFWDGAIPYDYITQVCLYLKGLQKVNPDISDAVLLIKNKNTSAYLEFLITWIPDKAIITKRIDSNGETINMNVEIPNIVNNAFLKFQQVEDYIQRKTLPKRQYENNDWHCGYCGWYQHCWKDYRKEFKELKTDAMLPNEAADMVRYYKELGGQKSDIEREYKKLAGEIKKLMKGSDIREGAAGEYMCRLKLIDNNRLDKTLLTPEEIERATVKGFQERLYVSNLNKKERGNEQ